MSQTEQVNVSSIQELPAYTKSTSAKLVQIICKKAKTSPDEIQTVSVGRVNSVLYAVNEFETILGLKKANVRKTDVLITDYSSMRDLLIAHVRKNFNPQTIDPLKIRQVIDYLAQDGTDRWEICKMLWLDKRPELLTTIRAEIADEARDVLLKLIDEISQKMYFVVTPVYYINHLSKIAKKEQYQAALQIKSFTISKVTSDEKFSWPSSDALATTLKEFGRERKIPPTEERIGRYEEIKDLKSKNRPKAKPSAKAVQKADKYICEDPNLIYVPIKGAHPDLLVHKKTGRVAMTKETNGTYSITDDLGKSTQILPDHVVRYLDVEDMKSIFICKYGTIQKAHSAFGKAKTLPGKCVVLSSSKLPRK